MGEGIDLNACSLNEPLTPEVLCMVCNGVTNGRFSNRELAGYNAECCKLDYNSCAASMSTATVWGLDIGQHLNAWILPALIPANDTFPSPF